MFLKPPSKENIGRKFCDLDGVTRDSCGVVYTRLVNPTTQVVVFMNLT